jgi:hypothetical protein
MAGTVNSEEQTQGTGKGIAWYWYALAGLIVLGAVWYMLRERSAVAEKMKGVREAKAFKAALKENADVSQN